MKASISHKSNGIRHLQLLLLIALSVGMLLLPALVDAATFAVNDTTDAVDSTPGDGICETATGNGICTLRAAVMEANAWAGADDITVPEGTFTLTILGVDETWAANPAYPDTSPDPYIVSVTANAAEGDLDISDSLTIKGAGAGLTIITWAASDVSNADIADGDRIFHVQATTANVTVAISDLTLTNGSVGIIPNTDPAVSNPYDIEIVNANPGTVKIWQFRRLGGALAFGLGCAVVLYEETAHGPGSSGGDGGDNMGPFPGGTGGDEGGFIVESAALSGLIIDNNKSGADGGGIHNAAPLSIQNSILTGNFAGANGGGIYNDAAMTMLNTTIGAIASPNTGENGGGLFDTGSHVTTITASTFSGNTATAGGAIAGRAIITFDITNSTISGNLASDVGGGITTNGTVNLNSATVVNNIATTDAPGGGAGLNSFGSGTYNMMNTLLAGNIIQGSTIRASNCGCSGGIGCQGQKMVSFGNNLEDADTCLFTEASDFVNTDPLIGPLQDNGGPTLTHSLLTGSPAIDAGSNVNCSVDQRGMYRPLDGNGDKIAICDIGAFELVAWVSLVTPNGGESIPSGYPSYNITWLGPSDVVAYSLQYSVDNGLTWVLIEPNVPGNPLGSSYAWTTVPVPAKNEPQCLIKVIGYNALGFEVGQDTSDAPFAIEVLRLDSPNGGEALQSGTQHPITWTTNATINPVAKVKILYTKNNGLTWKLIKRIKGDNPGRFVWTIPSVKKVKNNCRVKIVLKDSSGKKVGVDKSDVAFTLYP